MDLSIVILNYKQMNFIISCLKSITESNFFIRGRELDFEVIVVDNNSNDDIGKFLICQYPEVKFIQNKKNIGMGAGNNIGIKEATGDYIVVMNPDTIVFEDTFKQLYCFMEENKHVGVVGPKQLNTDKTIQNSCYRWPKPLIPIYRRTPIGNIKFARREIDRYLMKDFDHESCQSVDWLLGSFLFMRAAAIERIGAFDERFFMYFEDTDLCQRFWKFNWKVIYYPEAVILHNHNRHSAQTAWYNFFSNKASMIHILSWVKYLLKWPTNYSLR
ncbi:glycosyltransferase family 2 protein [uncultured Desulfobacter sp.]|uniref:glycosyltransferase family 2 protein n=1 Tax=uncultured Desulfobacter sp. TaxID=240139 RepID=UPI002AABFDB4|nr:glycosyltransferase family 2 protein [uncultured Desulfobacter sp.]